jgi:L-2,4-diaminobutyric acid acetyltransferase
MLLHQILLSGVKYFEATVNPSNEASKRSFHKLAELLHAPCSEQLLFSQADFGNDGHEEEVLYRIGPLVHDELKKEFSFC